MEPSENSALFNAPARITEPFTSSGSAKTYNLTVAGAHTYYANGMLVHNCDTCTHAWNLLRRLFWLQLTDEADEDDPTEKVRERRRHWYLKR